MPAPPPTNTLRQRLIVQQPAPIAPPSGAAVPSTAEQIAQGVARKWPVKHRQTPSEKCSWPSKKRGRTPGRQKRSRQQSKSAAQIRHAEYVLALCWTARLESLKTLYCS